MAKHYSMKKSIFVNERKSGNCTRWRKNGFRHQQKSLLNDLTIENVVAGAQHLAGPLVPSLFLKNKTGWSSFFHSPNTILKTESIFNFSTQLSHETLDNHEAIEEINVSLD